MPKIDCRVRGLQVQRDHHAQPDRVQAHGKQHRPNDWHHHEGNLDEVENEPEQEDHQHHQEECAEHERELAGVTDKA